MVYDQAYQLARSIQNSNEYTQYIALQDKVYADAQAKTMLTEYRKRQMELQMRQFSGESIDQAEMEQLSKLSEVINLNSDITQLLAMETQLSLLMDDVQRIISEPLKSLFIEDEED
jgi:cell fate (sporulation/competence/biofilm development) regulator YlbF (YheA/YmcA/DUF963 family)